MKIFAVPFLFHYRETAYTIHFAYWLLFICLFTIYFGKQMIIYFIFFKYIRSFVSLIHY